MVALTDAGADAEALQDSYAKRGTLLVVGLSIIIYIYIHSINICKIYIVLYLYIYNIHILLIWLFHILLKKISCECEIFLCCLL